MENRERSHPHNRSQLPRSPLALDYHSPVDELSPRKGVSVCGVLLVIGWIPYLCGVLNGLVARRYPWSDAIVTAHGHSSLAFMVIGALLSVIALIGLLRMRYIVGALMAGAVLMAQVSIALCLNAR